MNKEFTPLKAGIIAVAILGTGYILKHYFVAQKQKENHSGLSLEMTRQISQEIKVQIMIYCVDSAQSYKLAINQRKLSIVQTNQVKQLLKQKAVELYAQKQSRVLKKYDISHFQYEKALNSFQEDENIRKNQRELEKMLESLAENVYPDLSVPLQAQRMKDPELLCRIYLQGCIKIAKKMFILVKQKMKPNTSEQEKKALVQLVMHKMNGFAIKKEIYQRNGFDPAWGNANEIFQKIRLSLQNQNPRFKENIDFRAKVFELIFNNIFGNYALLTEEVIEIQMKELVKEREDARDAEEIVRQAEAQLILAPNDGNQPNPGDNSSEQVGGRRNIRNMMMRRNFDQGPNEQSGRDNEQS